MIKFNHVALLVKSHRRGKFSQKDLCSIMHLNKQTLSRLERGHQIMHPKHIVPFCEILDIKYDEMVGAILEDYEHELRSRIQRDLLVKGRNSVVDKV